VRGSRGGRANEQALSLSLSRDACIPYYKHPRCEITRATFPSCVPSCANPSGQGHAAINSLVGSIEGPPGSETPTVGAPGRSLLRVNEHLPVEFQMSSLQQPLQPRTMLRFGSLEFMSLDGSYDMVLLPPQHDSNNDGRQLTQQRRTRRRLPPRGGRAASGFAPPPSSPQEEETGQPWPGRRRHLVGCRASRRRRHPSGGHVGCCWGLVLKCYELRTRQHKMLNINALRPLKHYLPKDLMNFGRRP
jgi:hypothetical protein